MYLLEIKILLIKMWYAIDCKIPLHNRDIETCALESVKYNNPFFSPFEVLHFLFPGSKISQFKKTRISIVWIFLCIWDTYAG